MTLLELTIPFDTLLEDAARRKQAKYQDLVASVQESGYTVTLVTVEVGARGVPNIKAFSKLQSLLGLANKAAKDLMSRPEVGPVGRQLLIKVPTGFGV